MDNFSWTADASQIDGKFDRNHLDKILVRTPEIDDFLRESDTNKYFVVGPKGTGKTFLLKLKSKFCRENGWHCIPKSILCEKLSDISVSLSIEDLNKFKHKVVWEKVWELALYILILRRFSIQLPKEIVNVIGEHCEDLQGILYSLLLRRRAIDDLHPQVATYLRPMALKLRQDHGVSQLAVFIDNIDEAFDKHVGLSLKTASKNSVLDAQVWINAQISILTIARSICQANPHIKIFVAVRSEAFNNYNEPLSLQIRDNCISLTYTQAQVEEIFYKNIIDTPREKLVSPENKNILKRLMGIDTITNRYVIDKNGEKVTENIFDFIYRHTFGRPREIVEMGKNIKNIEVRLRTEQAIYEKINEVSAQLFNQLKNETVPFFEDEIFKEFCLQIGTNIYDINIASKVCDDIKKALQFDNVNSYLYRLGILGVPYKKDAYYLQTFLPVAQYSLSNGKKIPEFEWFFLHPATYSEMKDIHMSLTNFCNKHNIVGYNQIFFPPDSNSQVKQVHLGLDRDCLSVIIPEIAPLKNLSIFLKPTGEWDKLSTCRRVSFRYDDKSYEFLLYHDHLSKDEKADILRRWKENNYATLFYTNDKSILRRVIDDSETITFSQPTYADDWLKTDFDKHISKQVYICQRDYNPHDVKAIAKKLHSKSNKIKVDVAIIDRFLYRSSQTKNEEELVVYVTPETYSLLICRERDGSSIGQTATVRRPNDHIEFTFFAIRQQFFVEGIYQFFKALKFYNNFSDYKNHLDTFRGFIYLQQARIAAKFNESQIKNNLGFAAKFEMDMVIHSFALETLDRVHKLFELRTGNNNPKDIEILKSKHIFPSDQEFYSYLPDYAEYASKPVALKLLYDVLCIQPCIEYASLFISYSFKDDKFVKVLADKLILHGLKVFLFQYDDPLGQLTEIMADKIKGHDKVLFVASENSIRSDACQFELSKCIEKYESTWEENLIPIRLDDYVLKIQEFNIPEKKKTMNWKNISFMKSKNIKDFKPFLSNISDPEFEDAIVDLVENCRKHA